MTDAAKVPAYSWATLRAMLDPVPPSGPPVTISLFRHGESDWNARRLITGRADVPLTERGRREATAVGENGGRYYGARTWVSGLKRAQETCALVRAARGIPCAPACIDDRLDERSLGALEGTPRRSIPELERGDLAWKPDGGESYLDLAQRVLSFLVDLRACARREQHIEIYSHMGTMRIIAGMLDGVVDPIAVLRFEFPNAGQSSHTLSRLDWPRFIEWSAVSLTLA